MARGNKRTIKVKLPARGGRNKRAANAAAAAAAAAAPAPVAPPATGTRREREERARRERKSAVKALLAFVKSKSKSKRTPTERTERTRSFAMPTRASFTSMTLRAKLGAALAIPLTVLAVFAGLQVRSAYDSSAQVKRQAALATSATGPAGMLDALEKERNYEALRALGKEGLVDQTLKSSDEATTRTNSALGAFRNQLHDVGGGAADHYSARLKTLNAQLGGLRSLAEKNAAKASSAAGARAANVIFDDYTKQISDLLDVDQQAASSIGDAELRSGAELLNAIARQNDIEKRVVVKAIIAALAHDDATAAEVRELIGRLQAGAADLQVRAVDAYSSIIGPLRLKSRATLDTQIENALATAAKPNGPDELLRTSSTSTNAWRAVQGAAANTVDLRATSLKASSQSERENWIIATIGSLLLALAMLWFANKWITRPLRSLAEQASAMAGTGLPAAVKKILATPHTEEVHPPDVTPVKVRAGGEVRDLAAALNRVQESALDLAVEQASLRRNVADAYVNLGRRNQNLLSRQLEFITQLENDESDAETLQHLFKLDHLATRMRRNAESLLVLAGHSPPRTWTAPVAIGDVVRGALGEVEGYQRVRLRHLDDARVDGAAAADVSHVVAELTENALTFSPPDSDVEVYGRVDEHGYVLTIVDSGIGMPAEDLDRANGLITSADALTLSPSRFLGHYVVAQLAARHGLAVHLSASPAGGITAMIGLPPALLGMIAAPADAAAAEGTADQPPRPVAALPKREPAATSAAADADEIDAEPVPPVLRAVEPPPAPAPLAPVVPAAGIDAVVPFPQPELAPAPAPEPDPQVAPQPVAFAVPEPPADPEPVSATEATLEPAAEPPRPRPRIGVGSFADLRQAAPPAAPREPVAPPADAAPVEAPVPAAAAPPHPEIPVQPGPDHQATYAELAQAVEVATGRADAPAASGPTFSEDLLPSKLPKRGRRGGKLQAPWTREKPAPAVMPPGALLPAASSSEAPTGAADFAPPAPDVEAPSAPAAGPATAEGEERFAFFAAFRQAAERAREEAGIDDRRVGH